MLLPSLLGICAGTVTGLTPGIHVNLVATGLLALSPLLLGTFSPLGLACFVISMSVTHTFLDSLPSIFLGAPDADTALGVLPGHRYLLKGYGLMAVKLTLVGSMGATMLSILLFPLFIFLVRVLYPIIQPVIGWLLALVAAFMVFRDRKKSWAFLVFLLSGVLGLTVLSMPTLKNPLFPLLSGLFGLATLLVSVNESSSMPPQEEQTIVKLKYWIAGKALLSGQLSGFLTAMLPGLGAATAAVLSLQLTRDLGDHGYMVLQGSINTVNFILSLASLLVLSKARNGSIIAVQQLVAVEMGHVLLFLAVTAMTAGIAGILCISLGKLCCRLITQVPYRLVILLVILLILLLTPLLSGWLGLLVLMTATAVGMVPAIVKVARVHAMGCLLLPVILYFLG